MAKKPGFSGIRDKSITWAHRPSSEIDLGGKRVAVVGGTNGLGRAFAVLMASRGARVTVVGRTFRDEGVKGLEFVKADLEQMSEARRVADSLSAPELDLVVMTTGILAAPKREVTSEGIERDMAISYLSRLALVREFSAKLGNGRPAGAPKPRVFVMGFPGTGEVGTSLDDFNAEKSYNAMAVHMNTVAGNEALVLDAGRRYPNASFFGLNPGLIKTDIRANFMGAGSLKHRISEALIGLFMISPEKYAERIVPLLFAPEIEGRTGVMFNQKGDAILPTEALVESRVEEIMKASEKLIERALKPTPSA